MGWFEFPGWLDQYMNLLGQRGQSFLNKPLGFTDEMINAMYGKNFETLAGRQGAQREALTQGLGREGMLGTGAGRKALADVGWQTEKSISDTIRDIFIQSEQQKKQDLLNYSGMANKLFGTGINYYSLIEAINASRRGEGSNALALLLNLYGQMRA